MQSSRGAVLPCAGPGTSHGLPRTGLVWSGPPQPDARTGAAVRGDGGPVATHAAPRPGQLKKFDFHTHVRKFSIDFPLSPSSLQMRFQMMLLFITNVCFDNVEHPSRGERIPKTFRNDSEHSRGLHDGRRAGLLSALPERRGSALHRRWVPSAMQPLTRWDVQ